MEREFYVNASDLYNTHAALSCFKSLTVDSVCVCVCAMPQFVFTDYATDHYCHTHTHTLCYYNILYARVSRAQADTDTHSCI